MKSGRLPDYFPVDHRSNFSGYASDAQADDGLTPWPVRRRIGVFVAIALAAWIVVLSPLLLIG